MPERDKGGRPKDQGLIAVFGDPLAERILDVIEDSPEHHRREARQPLAEEAAKYVFEHENTQEALAVAFEALLVAMDEENA